MAPLAGQTTLTVREGGMLYQVLACLNALLSSDHWYNVTSCFQPLMPDLLVMKDHTSECELKPTFLSYVAFFTETEGNQGSHPCHGHKLGAHKAVGSNLSSAVWSMSQLNSLSLDFLVVTWAGVMAPSWTTCLVQVMP